jgi:hypothetical protein
MWNFTLNFLSFKWHVLLHWTEHDDVGHTVEKLARNLNFIGMIKDYRPWLLCDFQLPYKFGDVPHGFTYQQIWWNMKNDGQMLSLTTLKKDVWEGFILKMHKKNADNFNLFWQPLYLIICTKYNFGASDRHLHHNQPHLLNKPNRESMVKCGPKCQEMNELMKK